MGGIKAALKKASSRLPQHDPPGTSTSDPEHGLSRKKKKKNAKKKLKDFWEKKKQQQKNLRPQADEVSLKDAAMQLPVKEQAPQVSSPRTAPETVDSRLRQLPQQKTSEQIFRRQQEAPGKKGLEIMEVIVDKSDMGDISPISIDRTAFSQPQRQHHRQQQHRQPNLTMQRHFEQPSAHYTEGVGVELELAEALQLPSLRNRGAGGRGGTILDDLASETSESTRGRSRERAQGVSARNNHRRRIRPNSMGNNRIRRDEQEEELDSNMFSMAIDLTDVENEEQAMKLALDMNDPGTAFDDISNPLTAVPDVFGSLTDLLKDPPADSDMDDRTEGILSFKAGSASSKGGMDARDDSIMRGAVDVMKKESTKGAPFDPIDLTDCDYRLFVRKPAEAINVGFVEDADDAYDEMIEKSDNIVTKATHRMLGRNNTWYLG